jgi:hypothetical protein
MCRSIKTLRNFDQPPSHAEMEAAALQYVRKVSGYRHPAQRNEEAFNRAVREVTEATRRLLETLQSPRSPSRVAAGAGQR